MANGVTKQLVVTSVIDYYDGPLIFVAADIFGTSLLCTFLETVEDESSYLCVPVSRSRLNAFLKGVYDLREIYDNPESKEYFRLLTRQDTKSDLQATSVEISEIRAELLPALGYFAEPQNEIQSEAEARRSLVEASLEVAESKDSPVIETYSLASLLKGTQDAIKFAYKKVVATYPQAQKKIRSNPIFYSTQFYGFEHASFTAKLRSVDSIGDPDLEGNDDFDRAVEKVYKVVELAASSPESALSFLRENKGHFVSSIKRLISVSIERNCGLGIGWRANRSNSNLRRIRMSYDDAVRLQKALELESELEQELTEYVGFFTLINTESNPHKWGFQHDDDELLHGEVDTSKKITIAGVPTRTVRYRIWCEEKIIEDAGGKTKKLTLLYDFKPEVQPN